MSRFSARRLTRAMQTVVRLAPKNTLSPEQAKLYSNAVRTGWTEKALPTWDEKQADRQWHDATALVEAARVLKIAGKDEEATLAYRRAGDLLEWLSRSQAQPIETDGEPIPIALISACAFHLAGYPAMARGLLAEKNRPTATGALFAAFLRADFEATLRHCSEFWSIHMELTGQDGSWQLLQASSNGKELEANGEGDSAISSGFLGAEIVRCIGSVSKSLILNDQKLITLALEKFSGLGEYVTHTSRSHAWLTLTLIAEVAAEYVRSSLWVWSEGIKTALHQNYWDNFNAFVRIQFNEGKGLVWPSQKEGIIKGSSGGSVRR